MVILNKIGRFVLAAAIVGAVLVEGAAPGAAAPAAGSSAYDWPEMHGSVLLTGYAANGGVSTANAGSLGVHWSTDLYGAVVGSPVVAYDATSGKTLVYSGTDNGYFYAIDKATGAIVWADNLGGELISTPLVSNGAVWIASQIDSKIFKINASTGAVECFANAVGLLDATPLAATPAGGAPSVYFGVSTTVVSLAAGNCATQWTFKAKNSIWDSFSYGLDKSSEPLLLFGDANPDNSAYAIDAATGKLVWSYETTKSGDSDIGAGITISPPGDNGFADGVAYVPAKNGYVYALDLSTGARIWQVSLGSYGGVPNESLATAALDGNNLVVGHGAGAIDLNATTGAEDWSYTTPVSSQISPPAPSEVISSPAISGPAGQEVVVFGDLGGAVRALSLSSGAQLYSYQTGSWVTAGPAISGSDILVASTDGYLYDLSPGGGSQLPATVITSPVLGSSVAQSGGNLTVSGSASDASGVAAVVAAVRQDGAGGQWWDAATGKWSANPVTANATLSSPGGTTTKWTLSYPVPPSGSAYRVDAYAVSASGTSSVPAADDEFFVKPAPGEPAVGLRRDTIGPNGSLSLSGSGFGAGETVAVKLLGKTLATAASSASGTISNVRMTLPGSTAFGPTDVVATGATSGKTAAVALDVANSWTQQGYGPGRAGYEPYDPVVDNTIDPGQGILLDPAWHPVLGTGLTAPAVADQVVYAGDRSGALHAVSERTGAALWTWNTPGAAAITGAPAVNATDGLVIAGAGDGTLYAVHTSGSSAGKLAWSAHLGTGSVQAPDLNGGTLYAATNGTVVESLSAATGSVLWSGSTANGITGAPGFDPGKDVVVVPTTGSLAGLNATTGALVWAFPVTAPATPVLAGGVAYAGSGDHHVYAVSETTGKAIWTAATNGAVPDAGALQETTSGSVTALWIGSDDGNLYEFNASTGAQEAALPMGAGTAGVTIAGGTALVATSNGLVQGVRTYNKPISVWTYDTGGGALSPPAVVDGAFYTSGQNGALWAFTPYGQAPR